MDQSHPLCWRYVWAAWSSVLAGMVIAGVLGLWFMWHQGSRGERAAGVLVFYWLFFAASTAADVGAIFSLFGIRSRRLALLIIPGALLGLAINTCNGILCLLAWALEGRNLGG